MLSGNGGAFGQGGYSRLHPLQGSSNSAGVVNAGGSQGNKHRPASAKTGLDQGRLQGSNNPQMMNNPYQMNPAGVWPPQLPLDPQ